MELRDKVPVPYVLPCPLCPPKVPVPYVLPLSQAYGIKAITEEEIKNKEAVLEKALRTACRIPMNIVKAAYSSLKLHEELVNIFTKLAISDIGVRVQCLRASLLGGYLNVLINVKLMKNCLQMHLKKCLLK
ncbi:MAG: cyclodeaminase/cyclohydrolase family protein [Clostridia bacterium]